MVLQKDNSDDARPASGSARMVLVVQYRLLRFAVLPVLQRTCCFADAAAKTSKCGLSRMTHPCSPSMCRQRSAAKNCTKGHILSQNGYGRPPVVMRPCRWWWAASKDPSSPSSSPGGGSGHTACNLQPSAPPGGGASKAPQSLLRSPVRSVPLVLCSTIPIKNGTRSHINNPPTQNSSLKPDSCGKCSTCNAELEV